MTIPIVGGWCIYPKLMTSSETSASVGARSPAARMSRWDLPPLQRERCPHAPGNSNSVASAGGFSEPARARSVGLKIVKDKVVKTKKTMIDMSKTNNRYSFWRGALFLMPGALFLLVEEEYLSSWLRPSLEPVLTPRCPSCSTGFHAPQAPSILLRWDVASEVDRQTVCWIVLSRYLALWVFMQKRIMLHMLHMSKLHADTNIVT